MNLRVVRCTPPRVRPPHRVRNHAVCALYLEALEDRLVLSGPGTWSAFSPVGPAPRWGAPIVALGPLSVGNTFVTAGTNYFFGGTNGTTTFDDTWAITQGAVTATKMQPATSPSARHDQAAVAFNNKMYIFGGEDAAGNSLSDVWAFDPIADAWQQQPSQGGAQAWPGGFDAVAVAIGQQIILYGGSVSSGGALQPATAFAYAYNPAHGSWTKLAADPLGPDPGATAAAYAGDMYVFSSTSSTIESFNPVANTWSAVTVQGMGPAPRAHAAGVAISSIFLLEGGAGSSGDSWEFNFTTGTWTQKASFPDSGVQYQGAAAFYSSGVPLFMVYGGQVENPSTQEPIPNADAIVGRFQGVGAVVASDNLLAGLPGLVAPHLVVAEPGGTDTYFVELSGETSSATVTIPLSSTNPAEGTVSPSQLVFTPADARSPQMITVKGGANKAQNGDVLFQIQYGPIISSDPDWNGLTESVPVLGRPLPVFTVGSFGSFDITANGYPVTQTGAALPLGLSFDPATETISGKPDAGTARSYTLSFKGEAPSTTISFTLVVANGSNPGFTAPAVTMKPAGQTVNAGKTATFTAAASGSPEPSVQWQISTNNGNTFANITGATSSTLSFLAKGAMTGDLYRAVFTNKAGQTTSTAGILTVRNFSPMIMAQPASVSTTAQKVVRFTVVDAADPVATFQWQKAAKGSSKFTNIKGAASATLRIAATKAANGQKFRVVITNKLGKVTSTAAVLKVVKA